MPSPRARPLAARDHRRDPARWARTLGVSREAVELYLACDVIDLHTCSFIWARFGYDLSRRHRPHLARGTPFFNQVDFPRAREALTGIVWDITTNPYRTRRGRAEVFRRNLSRLRRLIARHPHDMRLVASRRDYEAARAQGLLACWVGVQGGNALDSLEVLDVAEDALSRVTLVHLSNSTIGVSATDWLQRRGGLTPLGRRLVEALVARRVFVDLSHINRDGFFDALDVVPPGVPVLVTHAGARALRDIPRNVDDEQLRAVAATGGVVGIVYQGPFLRRTAYDYGISDVVDHMEHVIAVVGEDHLALGSDYDGMVVLPRELPDVTYQPRLVAEMLRRGWSAERVAKVLGGNYLRALGELRP